MFSQHSSPQLRSEVWGSEKFVDHGADGTAFKLPNDPRDFGSIKRRPLTPASQQVLWERSPRRVGNREFVIANCSVLPENGSPILIQKKAGAAQFLLAKADKNFAVWVPSRKRRTL